MILVLDTFEGHQVDLLKKSTRAVKYRHIHQQQCLFSHVASGLYISSNCGSQAVINPCRMVLKNDSITGHVIPVTG